MANKVNKYKVGDKVKLVGDKLSVSGKYPFYGKIDTIKRVRDWDEEYYPYTLENHGYNWKASEFEPVNTQKIVITTDGKTTTAKLYEDNKVIKTAEAKCNPEDKFDFNVGASLAFNRLRTKYKKGDKVKVIANTCSHVATVGDVIILDHDNVCGFGKDHWAWKGGIGFILERDIEPYVEPLKPKYYNGKVVCVESKDKWFTVGKVYEIIDGKFTDNGGCHRPTIDTRVKTLDDLKSDEYFKNWYYKFIPFVES